MKSVHWLGQKESFEESVESAPISFPQANQTCADGLCHRPALPSLRRASPDASGARAPRLWRIDPGEDEGWLQARHSVGRSSVGHRWFRQPGGEHQERAVNPWD